MPGSLLPFLDEHEISVAADVDDVWRALLAALDGSFSRGGGAGLARVLGCVDRTAAGPRPLEQGSTVPGFRVVSANPGRELALEGRHRFSSYALIFHIDPVGPGHSLLRAESRATFPGLHGGVYRLLVVGSGGHVASVRSLLSSIRRRAERSPNPRAL